MRCGITAHPVGLVDGARPTGTTVASLRPFSWPTPEYCRDQAASFHMSRTGNLFACLLTGIPAGRLGQDNECRSSRSDEMIESMDHFWQNWSKTHAYVAERMFFPASIGEIAEAIKAAEMDGRPLRAVGGALSFSDASIPGDVTTNRPKARNVAAIAKVLPAAQKFPGNPASPFAAN